MLLQEFIELDALTLQDTISLMGPDDVARDDFIDVNTGEIILEKGKKARTSRLHPQYYIDHENARRKEKAEERLRRKREEQEERDEEERVAVERNKAEYEFGRAVKSFTKNWTNEEMPGVDPQDIVSDASIGFFYQYPQWKQWARLLGISREAIRELVMDELYEVMTGGL